MDLLWYYSIIIIIYVETVAGTDEITSSTASFGV